MSSQTTHNKNCFVFFLLTLFILIIYSNTFNSSWHFDDNGNVYGNEKLRITDFYLNTITRTFYAHPNQSNSPSPNLYRPVAMFSFALNWYFGQDNTFGYHVVNTLIHIITSFFLFLSIYHLLRSPNVKPMDSSVRYQIALLSAVIWAIHPIQIQAVTYIVQRMASMAAMFYIAGIYFYLKARFTDVLYKRAMFAFGILAMFALSVGSKENGVLMPLALVLLEITFFQNISNLLNKKRILLILLSVLTLLIASGLLGLFYFYGDNLFSFLKGYERRSFTLMERLLTEPRVICIYLYQIIYPVASQFSIEHEIEISKNLFSPFTTLPAITFIFIVIITGFYNLKKRPILSFAILFFFLNHLTESTIIPLELMFEHRNYLPSMFLFVPIAIIVVYFFENYKNRKEKKLQFRFFSLITSLVIMTIAFGTYTRNFDWLNEKSLWENAIKKAPGIARPYQNLAIEYYQKEGIYDVALYLHKKAIDLKDINLKLSRMVSLNNISNIYMAKQDTKLALEYSKQAVETIPETDMILNYVINLIDAKELELAYQEINKLLKGQNNNISALNLKTLISIKLEDFQQSYDTALKAIKIDPNDGKAISYLGLSSMFLGKYDKADSYLNKSLMEGNLGFMQIQKYFALIENSIRAGDDEKKNLYLARLIENFNIKAIKNEIKSMKEEKYPVLQIPLDRITNEIADYIDKSSKELRAAYDSAEEDLSVE
ncbi:MAG: hypothetical protein HQK64_13230 [Desulfamplus sp.]|nr:hypothetical protein [Desulfamplus sp.]